MLNDFPIVHTLSDDPADARTILFGPHDARSIAMGCGVVSAGTLFRKGRLERAVPPQIARVADDVFRRPGLSRIRSL